MHSIIRRTIPAMIAVAVCTHFDANAQIEGAFGNVFPSEINIAHTWNRSLTKKAGEMMGANYSSDSDEKHPAVNLTTIDEGLKNEFIHHLSQSQYLTAEIGIELTKGLQLNSDLNAQLIINPKEISASYTPAFTRVKNEAPARGEIHTYNNGSLVNPSQLDFNLTSEVQESTALQVARESVVLLSNKKDMLPIGRSSYSNILICGAGTLSEEFRQTMIEVADSTTTINMLPIIGDFHANDSLIARSDLIIAIDDDFVDRTFLEFARQLDKQVVLVLANTCPISLEWEKKNVDAILEVWQPGQKGINAIVETIYGLNHPCGKLTVEFPDFTFGHGLTYNQINYFGLKMFEDIVKEEKVVTVSFNVTNKSEKAGSEVVQLYLSRPESAGTFTLEAFKRVNFAPGETKNVSFKIRKRNMQILDENNKWSVSEGVYNVKIGSGSDNILLKDKFNFVL